MKYTENYHLPQWVETDRVLMKDFNQMCSDLEEGLTKNAEEAKADAAKADAHAEEAVTRAAAAHSAANTAQATANAAYCPTNQPYVTGTYLGDGGTITITLGFQPKFVLVSSQYATGGYPDYIPSGFALAGAGVNINGLTLLPDGFTVTHTIKGNVTCPPHINDKNTTYAYIAFR